jgi:alanine dehydrogenase
LIIAIPKEKAQGERRVALIPPDVEKLTRRGLEVVVERGAGEASGWDDDAYEAVAAKTQPRSATLWSRADLVV